LSTCFASENNKFVLLKLIDSFYKKYPDAQVLVQYGTSRDLADVITNNSSLPCFYDGMKNTNTIKFLK